MASGILITAVLVFAVRGMFLGFTGVVGKLIGFLLAYIIAFSFRNQLAVFISENTSISLPVTALQIAAGLVLFFGTLFLTGFLISMLFKSLGKVIPGFNKLVDKDSLGGKITGATLNGLIGAAIVLIGIWGYGKFANTSNPDDKLQNIANRFGDTLFSVVKNNADIGIQSFSSYSSSSYSLSTQSTSTDANTDKKKSSVTTSTGSAFIVSSSNPEKTISIENIQEIIESSGIELDTNSVDINNEENMQNLLNNPEIRDKALQYLQDNPQKIQEVLSNPQLKQLLETLSSSNQ